MAVKTTFSMLKEAGSDFVEDDAMTLAAALAFYTALSFAPMLMLLIWISGMLGDDAQQKVVSQFTSMIGEQAGQAVDMVIQNAKSKPDAGNLAGIFGIATLIFSATGVFAQLQAAMNRVWDVTAKPGGGIWNFFRKRLLSLGTILAIGFILVVSLVVSAGISLVVAGAGGWQVVNIVVTLGIYVLLFAFIYKILPDVKMHWKDVWIGATFTAVLFQVGKTLISLYLGHSSVGSSYGAAGSLVVLLVWVYYSSIILFFGAEMTQVWARRYGAQIIPDKHAVWRPAKEPKHKREESRTDSAKVEETNA